MGFSSPTGRGTFEADMCRPTVTHLRMCIAHCSLAAAGECACPAHAEDECISRREGCQDADGNAAYCQITLDSCSEPWGSPTRPVSLRGDCACPSVLSIPPPRALNRHIRPVETSLGTLFQFCAGQHVEKTYECIRLLSTQWPVPKVCRSRRVGTSRSPCRLYCVDTRNWVLRRVPTHYNVPRGHCICIVRRPPNLTARRNDCPRWR